MKTEEKIEDISQRGYSDDSPYRNAPYLDIHTKTGVIDMSNTGIPVSANGRVLPPYSGEHFIGDKVVREIPLRSAEIPKAMMVIDYVPKKGWVVFPATQTSSLKAADKRNMYETALKNKQVTNFGIDKEKALAFVDSFAKQQHLKQGGAVLELSDSEIDAYKNLGYNVDILDESSEMKHFEKYWDSINI